MDEVEGGVRTALDLDAAAKDLGVGLDQVAPRVDPEGLVEGAPGGHAAVSAVPSDSTAVGELGLRAGQLPEEVRGASHRVAGRAEFGRTGGILDEAAAGTQAPVEELRGREVGLKPARVPRDGQRELREP